MRPTDVELDGKRFLNIENTADGEVGGGTTFTYHQDGDVIWAEYGGGAIDRGWLIGTRQGDQLQFRYVHMNVDGETSSGRCHTQIEVDDTGAIRLRESWTWESRPGSGTSVLVEAAGA